jgi:hypothetical protein
LQVVRPKSGAIKRPAARAGKGLPRAGLSLSAGIHLNALNTSSDRMYL